MRRRQGHTVEPHEQRLRVQLASLQRQLENQVRARDLARQHGAGARELERRRQHIARLRWRLGSALHEDLAAKGPEAA